MGIVTPSIAADPAHRMLRWRELLRKRRSLAGKRSVRNSARGTSEKDRRQAADTQLESRSHDGIAPGSD